MQKKMTEGLPSEATEAPLPAERAFVVQFRAQTDPDGNLFTGRVEHIASGATQRFGSAAALIAFMTQVLAPAPSSGEERSIPMPKGGKTA